MNAFYLSDDSSQIEKSNQIAVESEQEATIEKSYFEIDLPIKTATFKLNNEDWTKLKGLQRGHRFQRGEWEDYFVVGMKQSNKYCVFAFKDHYVNQTNFRMRNSKMETGGSLVLDSHSSSSVDKQNLEGKKLFSANGYCVFEDCSIKFGLKMNDQLEVHVFYSGKLKHLVNEVHARYFRGKSRQDLKDALKHTTPLREYLQRIQTNSSNGNMEAGNADYVGKSHSVYKRIAAEAKDCYQALISLRSQFIEKSLIKLNYLSSKIGLRSKHFDQTYLKGYIQLIQHIPGCIICFSHEQVCLYHHLFLNSSKTDQTLSTSLSISFYKLESLVSTTINSNSLYFYEMCIKKSSLDHYDNLIPLTCMFTTNPLSTVCLTQWINMFSKAEKSLFLNSDDFDIEEDKYIVCDNSMSLIESLLEVYNKETYLNYSNRFYKKILNNKTQKVILNSKNFDINFDEINSELIDFISEDLESNNRTLKPELKLHVCTNQFITEIRKLCKLHYSFGNNFNFGMYALTCIVNSENLIELELSLYAFMCILYSKTIVSLVEKAFNYLKVAVNYYESLTKGKNSSEFYFYNHTLKDNDMAGSSNDIINEEFPNESNKGLSACLNENQIEEFKLNSLNSKSVFYKMCEKIFEKCKQEIEKCEKEENHKVLNPRMGHKLLYHFINQFSSTIPLWTKIVISNYKNVNVPLTLKAQNERFDKLRNILVSTDSHKETVDNFIRKLEEEDSSLIEENVKIYGLNFNELSLIENKSKSSEFSPISILIQKDNKSCRYNLNDSETNTQKLKNYLNLKKNKTNKNELFKPKLSMNKRLKPNDSNQFDNNFETVAEDVRNENEQVEIEDNSGYFNLVRLSEIGTRSDKNTKSKNNRITDTENEEKEIVIERQQHIITNDFGFELTKEDLETLENPNSLNSNIIQFYLKLLEANSNSEIFVYPVSFYPILKYGYNSNNINSNEDFCSSNSFYLNENFNLFNYNLVLVPIQKTDHWAIAAIDFKIQKITYFDSLLINDFECLKYLTEYINKQFMKKNETNYDFQNWKISNEKNIAKQSNSKDSGVFILFYAKRIVSNQDVSSSTNEVEEFRHLVKKEIYEYIFK